MHGEPSVSAVSGWRRALLAVAFAEILRPLFVRWAGEGPRTVYERIMVELWASAGSAIPNGWQFLIDINDLPDAHYDDSHHRDYYVMLALGVLDHVFRVVQDSDKGADDWFDARELDSILDHLVSELGAPNAPADLREAALRAPAASDRETVVSEMRQLAVRSAATVNSALDETARNRGWQPDRLRRS